MSSLNQVSRELVLSHLEASEFSVADFDIDFDHEKRIALILFKPINDYHFAIDEIEERIDLGSATDMLAYAGNYKTITVPITIEFPGDHKASETNRHSSLSGCINRIKDWCENLSRELSATASVSRVTNRDLEDLERDIQERAESEPNEPFSREEIDELLKKLSSFESELETLREMNAITENDLEELKDKIEQMGKSAAVFTKKVWYRTAGSKMLEVYRAVSKTPEGKAFLSKVGKNVLTWVTKSAL